MELDISFDEKLSTHSRPKAAAYTITALQHEPQFQHTAARRRLPFRSCRYRDYVHVSTHSRAEAAAKTSSRLAFLIFSFNTQPHGGGCHFVRTTITP